MADRHNYRLEFVLATYGKITSNFDDVEAAEFIIENTNLSEKNAGPHSTTHKIQAGYTRVSKLPNVSRWFYKDSHLYQTG